MRRLALLALLIVGVVGSELGLRAAGWHEREPAFAELARERLAGVEEFDYHPDRFYTLAPHHAAAPEHLGRYALGAWPFRGRPFVPAPAGVLRVAVVGDSSMYGFGVETAASVPALLQSELVALGHPRDAVVVGNFGVSGYTTVQVDLCVADVLQNHAPDVVVIGCGGWNDQGPSLGIDDVEMLLASRPPEWGSLLEGWAGFVHGLGSEPMRLPAVDSEELNAAWERGEPLFGTKVPEAEVQRAIARALERCAEAGVPAVVIVPGHPASTLRDHPRTGVDRDSVRRAGRAAGVPIVDGPRVYEASGLSDERLHLDFGHPTPEGNAYIARALAPKVAACLDGLARSAPDGGLGGSQAFADGVSQALRIVEWQPRVLPLLGDGTLEVHVEGLAEDQDACVLVGSAPLLELERVGPGRLRGRVMANAEGMRALVVQSSQGIAVVEEAVRFERPRLERAPGREARLLCYGRPGDTVELYWSPTKRAEPDWWEAGRIWLGGQVGGPWLCQDRVGEDGVASFALPPEALLEGEVWYQARVGPRDVGPWDRIAVVSEPLGVRF